VSVGTRLGVCRYPVEGVCRYPVETGCRYPVGVGLSGVLGRVCLVSEVPPIMGLRPQLTVGAPRRGGRRQSSLETNVIRKGLIHVSPTQLQMPLSETQDVLGWLRVRGQPLQPFDLDTLAWITERWRETGQGSHGEVRFTLYELGQDMFDHEPSGRERQLLRESIRRLQDVEFVGQGWVAKNGRIDWLGGRDFSCEGGIRLLGSVIPPKEEHKHHIAYLDGWMAKQLQANHLTYLDWRVQRELDGTAKVLWTFLESQTFKRSGIGVGESRLWLKDPLWASLGITAKRPQERRRTLTRAAGRIVDVDASYSQPGGFVLDKPASRGGTWSLVARRTLAAG